MKRIKVVLTLLCCCCLLLTGFSPYIHNEENKIHVSQELNKEGFPESVTINGKEKIVNVISWEEYYRNEYNSNHLVVISDEIDQNPIEIHNKLEPITIHKDNIIGEILLYVGDKIAGKIIGEVFVYLVNSGIARTVALKAFAAVGAVMPYLALATIGISYAFTIYNTITGIVKVNSLQNSSGCVWNGPQIGGNWVCPFKTSFIPSNKKV